MVSSQKYHFKVDHLSQRLMYLFSESFVVPNISLCVRLLACFTPEDANIGIAVDHTLQFYLVHQILSKFGEPREFSNLRFNWSVKELLVKLNNFLRQVFLQLTFNSAVLV